MRTVKRNVAIFAALGFWLALSSSPALAADNPSSQAIGTTALFLAAGKRPAYPTQTGLLPWEIYRQSFLIAARDGVGISTRDESLREWSKAPPSDIALTISLDGRKLTINKTDKAATVIWQGTIEGADWPNNCAGIAATAEPLSRGEFLSSLRAAGWSGTGNVQRSDASAPKEVEGLLGKLDELSQFAALRLTHAAIRADGESPARLGALVRAYANLGQLTMYHWSLETDVYAARSLLYAQRMLAASPNSPTALWHLAYAQALAGLQRSALDNLTKAGSIAEAPAWVGLLKPFCEHNTAKLTELAASNKSQASWANLLAYLTLENTDCEAASMKLGETAMQADPNCFRLIDSMCDLTGPGMRAQLIQSQESAYSQLLGSELTKMPQIPQKLVDLIESLRQPGGNPQGRQTVAQTLLDSGDASLDNGEPSWTALGRMMQEITFAQTWRRLQFLAFAIGTDTSDEAKLAQPLVADHPYKDVINGFAILKSGKPVRDLLQAQNLDLITPAALPMMGLADAGLNQRQQNRNGSSDQIFLAAFRNLNCTSFDAQRWAKLYHNQLPADAQFILDWTDFVDPQSPMLVVAAIQKHWDLSKAADWETAHKSDPQVMFALGQKYADLQKWSDAERCLKQYIALSPDLPGYRALGKIYQDQKLDDQWLALMKDYLNQEDYGLQHAMVQVEVAHYLLGKGNKSEAVKYANDAAETGASWALSCAAGANAEAGNWDAAGQYVSENNHAYDVTPYPWYLWCVRTGHGDRTSAAAELRQHITSQGDQTSDADMQRLAILDVSENKLDLATDAFKNYAQGHSGAWPLLYSAILADEKGDAATRDSILANAPHGNPPLQKFASILMDTFKAGQNAKPDMEAIDVQVKRATGRDHITICYLTARYLDDHGDKDDALSYLRRCITNFTGFTPDLPLAYDALRKHGIDPLDIQRQNADDKHPFSLEP